MGLSPGLNCRGDKRLVSFFQISGSYLENSFTISALFTEIAFISEMPQIEMSRIRLTLCEEKHHVAGTFNGQLE